MRCYRVTSCAVPPEKISDYPASNQKGSSTLLCDGLAHRAVQKVPWSLETGLVMSKALSSMAQTEQRIEQTRATRVSARPEVSRLSDSCYTADTPMYANH